MRAELIAVLFGVVSPITANAQVLSVVTLVDTIQGAGETLFKIPFSARYPAVDAELFMFADTLVTGEFRSAAGLDIESKPFLSINNANLVSQNDSTAVLTNWADSLRVRLMFNIELDTATLEGDGIQLGFTTLAADTFALTVKVKYPKYTGR